MIVIINISYVEIDKWHQKRIYLTLFEKKWSKDIIENKVL